MYLNSFYNIFLRQSTNIVTPANIIESPNIIAKPHLESPNGRGTFIPQKLAISVGTAMMIVMDVKSFMTLFRLLLIIEENVDIVLFNIFL